MVEGEREITFEAAGVAGGGRRRSPVTSGKDSSCNDPLEEIAATIPPLLESLLNLLLLFKLPLFRLQPPDLCPHQGNRLLDPQGCIRKHIQSTWIREAPSDVASSLAFRGSRTAAQLSQYSRTGSRPREVKGRAKVILALDRLILPGISAPEEGPSPDIEWSPYLTLSLTLAGPSRGP